MKAKDIVCRLERVTKNKSSEEYMALCPAHEGEQPMLWVKDTDYRTSLLCIYGCSEERVLNALSLTTNDLSVRKRREDLDEFDMIAGRLLASTEFKVAIRFELARHRFLKTCRSSAAADKGFISFSAAKEIWEAVSGDPEFAKMNESTGPALILLIHPEWTPEVRDEVAGYQLDNTA